MMSLPHPLPDWVKSAITTLIGAIIGAVIAFISGFVADTVRTRRAERHKCEKMRKAVYVEITQHYHAIRILLDVVESPLTKRDEIKTRQAKLKEGMEKTDLSGRKLEAAATPEKLSEQVKGLDAQISQLEETFRSTLAQMFRLVPMDCYRYAKSNPDIFYEIREAFSIDACYAHLQFLATQIESTDVKRTLDFAKSFIQSVDEGIEGGALDDKMFKSVSSSLHAEMGVSKKSPPADTAN